MFHVGASRARPCRFARPRGVAEWSNFNVRSKLVLLVFESITHYPDSFFLARDQIELQTWGDSNAPYAALMSYFGNKKVGRNDQAQKILTEASAHTDAKSWPATIMKYLAGDLNEKELLALATDNDKMTEARAYVGMHLALKQQQDAARSHLDWVVKNGNRDFIEYTLAKVELRRLTSK